MCKNTELDTTRERARTYVIIGVVHYRPLLLTAPFF
jgi:hypothetical protein